MSRVVVTHFIKINFQIIINEHVKRIHVIKLGLAAQPVNIGVICVRWIAMQSFWTVLLTIKAEWM